jgi:hypothetical protein
MGYEEKATKIFSRRFRSQRRLEAPALTPPVEAIRKGRIGHVASLVQFLIFCKDLLFE